MRVSIACRARYTELTKTNMDSIMRLLRMLLIILIAFVGFFGFRWHTYVSNTDSPYDEVGITLNSNMPLPIRKWGCDKLHATFGNVLPPYGCQQPDGDGRSWL
jgi:hypothetical protein